MFKAENLTLHHDLGNVDRMSMPFYDLFKSIFTQQNFIKKEIYLINKTITENFVRLRIKSWPSLGEFK